MSRRDSSTLSRLPYFHEVLYQIRQSVDCTLFSVPNLELDATGENTARVIDKSFNQLAVPWANCVAFGCDNAVISDV